MLGLFLLLVVCGCGKQNCDDKWSEMDEKRKAFLASYQSDSSRAEEFAVTNFGEPTLKKDSVWRWDISVDGTSCGKWWVEFPPATIAVGREDAFSHPEDLP